MLKYLGIFLIVVLVPLAAQDEKSVGKIGSFNTLLIKKSPLSDMKSLQKRMGWTDKLIDSVDPKSGYDLRKELFFVHVPDHYDGKKPFGLFVWIAPGEDGRPAQDWPQVLKSKNMIFVGAQKSGNERFVWNRIALALDAVHNMKARYKIDPNRVYVGGHSGGGRLASTLGFHWADVFQGGIYGCGTNYFRAMPRPNGGLKWQAKIKKPKGTLLRLTRTQSRHIFINGETDFNRAHARATQKDLKSRQRFKHTSFIEMKGQGHIYPPATYLSQCFTKLDAPLEAAKKAAAKKAARKAAKEAEQLKND